MCSFATITASVPRHMVLQHQLYGVSFLEKGGYDVRVRVKGGGEGEGES
jgi:hypothetical protein